MAKLHKVEFCLVDYNSIFDIDCIEETLNREFGENAGVTTSKIQTVDIGEWHDDHKFNLWSTPLEEYEKEFEEISSTNKTIRDCNTKNEYSEDCYYQAIRME